MAKAPSPKTPPAPTSYETALHELEQLVARIEAGELPLDELLDSYRRGADLLGYCRTRLTAVEEQIRLLDASALSDDEESA